jgi:hypothetical protein
MTTRIWVTLGICSSLVLTGGALLMACAPSWGSPAWPATSRAVQKAPPAVAALKVKLRLSEYTKRDLHDENIEFIVAIIGALRDAGIEVVNDDDGNGHAQAYDLIIETMYDERMDTQHSGIGAKWFWNLRPVLADRETTQRSGWRARFDAGAGLAASAPWGSGHRADSEEAERLTEQLDAVSRRAPELPERAKGDNARGPRGEPSEGHRLAATYFVNQMVACPELASLAEFIGSHGALARDLRRETIDRLNAHWDKHRQRILPPDDPFYFDRSDDRPAPDEPPPVRAGTGDADPSEATTSEERAQIDQETRDVANAVDATARSLAEARARLGEAARRRRRQNGVGSAGLPGRSSGCQETCRRFNSCTAPYNRCSHACPPRGPDGLPDPACHSRCEQGRQSCQQAAGAVCGTGESASSSCCVCTGSGAD